MGNEYILYFRAILALAFVTGLIWLLAAFLKKTGLDTKMAGNRNPQKRLSIAETLYLDPKNRLVVVEFTGKEHLFLLGVSGNLLIESRVKGGKDAE